MAGSSSKSMGGVLRCIGEPLCDACTRRGASSLKYSTGSPQVPRRGGGELRQDPRPAHAQPEGRPEADRGWLEDGQGAVARLHVQANVSAPCSADRRPPPSGRQDEFRQKKATLINKETKKRMLEQVWQDKVVIDEEQEREAAAEAAAKKAEVVALKSSNRERRAAVRQQAERIESALVQQAAEVSALRASHVAVEAERAAEAEAQQREAALLERIALAKRRLEEADGRMYSAQTEVEKLQHKKGATDAQVEEVNTQIRRETQVCASTPRSASFPPPPAARPLLPRQRPRLVGCLVACMDIYICIYIYIHIHT